MLIYLKISLDFGFLTAPKNCNLGVYKKIQKALLILEKKIERGTNLSKIFIKN